MRTLLGGELTQAQDRNSDYYVKLEVQNGSGTWIDVGAALGSSWIINASWGEVGDTPVSQATVTLVQKVGTASLAPLMSMSALNVDDTLAYSPLLEIGRLVRMSTATMAHGVALDVTKYRKMFEGRIDDVDLADSPEQLGPVTIKCSDLGGWLMDLQIETDAREYGAAFPGTPLETVLQAIIDDNRPVGDPAVTVVKTSLSNFGVGDSPPHKLGQAKVLEALTALVLDATGEDIRYRFNASHVSTLQWFNPARVSDWSASTAYVVGDRVLSGGVYYKSILAGTNHAPPNGTYWATAIDATFAPTGYVLRTLARSLANIRNAGQMAWSDGVVTAASSGSIASYRRRWFNLPASVFITTEAEAQAVIDAVVNDLSGAPEEAAAELPYFWPVQLYDLYTFAANDRQYDQDQTLSVVGYQHSIENGRGSTTLTVAGRVVGAYAAWRRRIGLDVAVPESDISLNDFRWTDSSDGLTRTFTMLAGAKVFRVGLFLNTLAVPPTSDPWPSVDADPVLEPNRVTPREVLTPDASTRLVTYALTVPTVDYQTFAQFVPWLLPNWSAGPVRRVVVDAAQIVAVAQGTVSIDANGAWGWAVDGPAAMASAKYAESTSAYPNDAAAAAGPTGTGRQISRTGGTPLTFGQTIYVTIIPYTADGTALSSIRLQGSYQTFSGSKTTTYSPSGWDVKSLGLGGAEVDSVTFDSTTGWAKCVALPGASFTVIQLFPPLPAGVTITSFAVDVDDTATGGTHPITFAALRIDGSTATSLGVVQDAFGAGVQTLTLAVSESSTTGRGYSVTAEMDGAIVDNSTTAGKLKVGPVRVTYTQPDPQKNI